jgi:hypothetical protein
MAAQDISNRLSIAMNGFSNRLTNHHDIDNNYNNDEDDDSVGAPDIDVQESEHTTSGDASISGTGKDDGSNPSSSQQQLGSKETSNVNRAKLVAYLVLVVTATTVAFMVHRYMTNVENNLFEKQFSNDSRKIINSIGRGVVNSLAVLDNFGFVAVSLAQFFRKDKGIPAWPFVSIPDFGLRAAKDRASCSGITFSFQPVLVGIEQRIAWETFTSNTTNQYWVNQSKVIQETDRNYFGTSTYNTSERTKLWNEHGDIPYDVDRYVTKTESRVFLCRSGLGL